MIASLPMYDRPETASANDRLWARVRDALGFGPEQLDRDATIWNTWLRDGLLLSQTCSLPYRTSLHDKVQLVGTPDYGLEDTEPGYYYSVFIARRSESGRLADCAGKEFAYNGLDSQSGWAAPMQHLTAHNLKIGSQTETGSHRESARSVAKGRADFAALDALTWRMIKKYDPFASDLISIARTDEMPGLPLITGTSFDSVQLFDAFDAAVRSLSQDDRETLSVRGIEHISKQAYLALADAPRAENTAKL